MLPSLRTTAPALLARLGVALVPVLAACSTATTAPGATAAARVDGRAEWVGDTLRLPFGASAALPGGAVVTFEARGEDSRCPIDALCVWEGDAAITVRVAGAGVRTVHTNSRAGADTLTAGTTTLRLFGLTPSLSTARPRPEDADVVALFVARRG